MKQFKLPLIKELATLPLHEMKEILENKAEQIVISTINWKSFPYCPLCVVQVARTETSIILNYIVRGLDLRAAQYIDNEAVCQDSCVEFFVKLPNSSFYFNFEFNCIGVCLGAKRKSREEFTRIDPDRLTQIKRHSTVGNQPFEEKSGIHSWELTVEIPFELMDIKPSMLPEKLLCNFYKCGDKTAHPHYLSWNPIGSPTPDFHRPEYFGEMSL